MEELAIIISVVCTALLLHWIYGIIIYVIMPYRKRIYSAISEAIKLLFALLIVGIVLWFMFKGINRCMPINPEEIHYDYDRSLHHK